MGCIIHLDLDKSCPLVLGRHFFYTFFENMTALHSSYTYDRIYVFVEAI